MDPSTAMLIQEGVPQFLVGNAFVALEHLETIYLPSRGELVCFGLSGQTSKICIDKSSGEVIQLVGADDPQERFVNESLHQFVRSVEAVNARFPFYDLDADMEVCEEISDEIAAELIRIDSAALEEGSFWDTVIATMMIGDLATEMIDQSNA